MAFDCYMYFEEPKDGAVLPEGETTDDEFSKKKAFEIYSFSWGASNPMSLGSGSGGAGTGKVQFSDFNVMKRFDKATPKLMQTMSSGGHFGKAHVVMRKTGTDKTKAGDAFIILDFHMVFVTSVQESGSSGGDDVPTESVSFTYGAVEMNYKPQDKAGKLGTPVPFTWSVIKNNNTTQVE
jgi:type VI secretion system secreted protein Hcp